MLKKICMYVLTVKFFFNFNQSLGNKLITPCFIKIGFIFSSSKNEACPSAYGSVGPKSFNFEHDAPNFRTTTVAPIA